MRVVATLGGAGPEEKGTGGRPSVLYARARDCSSRVVARRERVSPKDYGEADASDWADVLVRGSISEVLPTICGQRPNL